MRLFKYELYKLFHQRVIVLACLGFIVANFCTFLMVEKGTSRYYFHEGDAYERFQNTYAKEQTPKERIETMQRLIDLSLFYSYDYWTERGEYIEEERQEFAKKMVKKYGEGIIRELEEMKQEIDFRTANAYDVYAKEWLRYAQYAEEYDIFRNEMKQRADKLQKVKLFSKKGSFANANLMKTYQDFNRLGKVKISFNNQYGVKAYLRYGYTSVFLIFTVLIFCVGIWQRDNEKGFLSLLKSQKRGKLSLFAAKMGAMFFCICLMNLIYLLTIFLVASNLYGMGDLSMSIQSVETYRNCCWNLNAGQFIVLCAGTQAVAACVSGLIFSLCFQMFRRNTQVYIVCGALVLVCLGCNMLIQPNSSFSILKYINLAYGMQPVKLYGIYRNLNVFGNALSIFPVLAVFITLLFFAGITFGGVVWCTGKKVDRFSQGIIHLKRKKIYGTKGILRVQLYDFLIRDKKLVFCLILLAYGIYTAFYSFVYYMPQSDAEPNYREYVKGLEGMFTEETEKKIEEKEQYFENVWKRIEVLGSKKTMDAESYAEMVALSALGNAPYRGFQQLKEQYDYLKERKSQGKEAVLLDFYNWNRPFQSVGKEVRNLMLAVLMTVFLSGSLFADHSNMKRLTVSMKKGRRSLWRRKYLLGLGTAMLSWLCLVVPEAICFFRQNDVSLTASQLGNLPLFSQVKENSTIAAVMAGMYLSCLLVCMIAASVTMVFVDLSGNSFISMIVVMMFTVIGGVILLRKRQGIFGNLVTQSIYPLRNLCLVMIVMLILIGVSLFLWEKEIFFPKGKRKVRT